MKFAIKIFVFLFLVSGGYAQKVPSIGRQWLSSLIETGKEWQAERKLRSCEDTLINNNIRTYTESPDYREKWMALRTLAEIACPVVQDFLLRVALFDTGTEFRMLALKYLVWVDAQNAIPFLWERSRDSIEPLEQIRIGLTLLLLEDEQAVSILNENCFQTEDKEVCKACFDAFFYVKPKDASKYYLFRLKCAKDERDSVNMGIGLAQKEKYRDAINVLNKLSTSSDPDIRGLVAFGLGFVDSKESSVLLEKLGRDTSDHDIQRIVSDAVERLGKYRAVKKKTVQQERKDVSQNQLTPQSISVNTPYNREAAVAYAKKWCNGINNTMEDGGPYFDYNRYGGDCAAFFALFECAPDKINVVY